jgi:hypothetical protein
MIFIERDMARPFNLNSSKKSGTNSAGFSRRGKPTETQLKDKLGDLLQKLKDSEGKINVKNKDIQHELVTARTIDIDPKNVSEISNIRKALINFFIFIVFF